MAQSNPQEYGAYPFVEFFCGQTFGNDYLLQLMWDGESVEWQRTTWLKAHNPEVWDVDTVSATYSLKLTCQKEKGTAAFSTFKEIIRLLENIRMRPIFYNENQGRDGECIQLKMGQGETAMTVEWATAHTPDGWLPMDEVAHKFQTFNATLHGDSAERYSLSVQTEESSKGRETWTIVQKI